MSATATPISPPATTLQLVVFSIGEERYALPMDKVQEIIRYTKPRSIDSPVAWLRGVISLRGRILPVCDLAAQLGVDREHDPDTAKIVIVDTHASTAGVIVDEVDEVITINREQLEPIPTGATGLLESIATVNEQLILIVAPDRMLESIASE